VPAPTAAAPAYVRHRPDDTVLYTVVKKHAEASFRQMGEQILVAPFNERATAEQLIAAHAGELAAVIVEPLQRCLPTKAGFLEPLRAATGRHGVLLIFDEVVTGFRLAYGGAQAYYDVIPDMALVVLHVLGVLPASVAHRENLMASMFTGTKRPQ